MHGVNRGLSLLLELRPPLGLCLVDQREAESLPGEQLRLMLSSSWMSKVRELQVQDTEAGGFEGVGLQRTPRLVFQSGWKCCLVFPSFLSSFSDPKKQLKPLETANLKGEKKTNNPTLKLRMLKGFIFQESGVIFGKADGVEKQKAADSPCFWSHWAVGAVRPAHILDPPGHIPGCAEPRLRFISAVSHYLKVLLEQHQSTVLAVL